MKFVEDVFEIAESFMENPRHVSIDYQKIEIISQRINKIEKPKFPVYEIGNPIMEVLSEIIAGAINYCYWYGSSYIRPKNSSSTKMYELLLESRPENHEDVVNEIYEDYLDVWISNFKKSLAINRFPLLEERCKHLDELNKIDTLRFASGLLRNRFLLEDGLTFLIENYPGYASDIFLKRASLLFIQFFRRFGWFKDELQNLHVPADYQVPKMLERSACFDYSPDLYHKIESGQLIPKNSQEECEIRSATILVIKKLCDLTGWNVAEVDAYFFLKRHQTQNPFHLTITTDY
jgi:hypothetical protein